MITPPVQDLGRCAFSRAYSVMRAEFESIRAGTSDGKILFVEHDPIYTAGRATPESELGADTVRIERGGRVTYHGPGQLVVYPVLPLLDRDVHAWLRRLEAFGVAVCAELGLDAEPSVDGTGVFVGGRKVASIGVAIRRWINLHGIAINVDMDLGAFGRIRPCGLSPEVMSDLRTIAERTITLDDVRRAARSSVGLLTHGKGREPLAPPR